MVLGIQDRSYFQIASRGKAAQLTASRPQVATYQRASNRVFENLNAPSALLGRSQVRFGMARPQPIFSELFEMVKMAVRTDSGTNIYIGNILTALSNAENASSSNSFDPRRVFDQLGIKSSAEQSELLSLFVGNGLLDPSPSNRGFNTQFQLTDLGTVAYTLWQGLVAVAPQLNQSSSKTVPGDFRDMIVDLTETESGGKETPFVGREQEIDAVINRVLHYKKANPVLIGEPGVGKTALVHGLAAKIAKGEIPELGKSRVWELNLGALLSGTKYRGDLEERVTKLIKYLEDNPNIILFVDEAHNLLGAGQAEGGGVNVSEQFKSFLGSSNSRVIASTTEGEYRRIFKKDAALERRFQPIQINEPDMASTKAILRGVILSKLEQFHGVKFSPEIIEAIVNLAFQYVHTDRHEPDRSLDIADEAAVLAKRARQSDVQMAHVHEAVRTAASLPLGYFTDLEERLKNPEAALRRRIVGQDEAVKRMAKVLRDIRMKLSAPERPPSFLFCGPTGVGKTEMARALQEILSGNENDMLKIDMADLAQPHSIAKLTGAPQGYVGYNDEGMLAPLKTNPFRVILMDELEKADPGVLNQFLSALDDGHMTMANGTDIDLKHCIVIMTSNLGTQFANKHGADIGFSPNSARTEAGMAAREHAHSVDDVTQAIRASLKPEFLNRLSEDGIIVFKPLMDTELKQIMGLKLTKMCHLYQEGPRHVTVTLDSHDHDRILTFLKDQLHQQDSALDFHQGGRLANSTIERCFNDPFKSYLETLEQKNGGKLPQGLEVVVKMNPSGNGLQFDCLKSSVPVHFFN